MTFLDYFLPDARQALGLSAVLANFAVFAVLGAAVSGRGRIAGGDIFAGWGIANALFVIGGALFSVPFTWLAYFLWAAAVPSAIVLWRRHRQGAPLPADGGVLWMALALSTPIFFLAAAMVASQWDDFSQWIPNAWYVFRYDGFPGKGMAVSPSTFPAYPYGLPLISYLASRLSGGFVESASALANWTLLIVFVPLYLDAVGKGLGAPRDWSRGWGATAFGILGVTVLSTIFIQKLVFTAHADTATAVAFGAIGFLAWKILDKLATGEGGAHSLAWQFGLVAIVFLNLKQTNLVLLVLLLGGMLLVVLRDPTIRIPAFLKLLPSMLVPGFAVYLSWRYHVASQLTGGEFSLYPYEQWLLPQAFEILWRMFTVIVKKGAYLLMMVTITVFALRGLWRCRSGFDRFAIVTGAVFVGYNLFLWAMYIAAFGPDEGTRAASFWRYNTQLGILGCTTAAFGAAIVWRRHVAPRLASMPRAHSLLAGFAVLLVLALPAAAAKKLRFDIRPQKTHMRQVGQELGRTLPEGSRLAIIDPGGVGFADQVIRFELTSGPGAGRELSTTYKFRVLGKTAEELRLSIEDRAITHFWVHRTVEGIEEALGVELAPRNSHLLKFNGEGWELLKSWPYPGYDDPLALPD